MAEIGAAGWHASVVGILCLALLLGGLAGRAQVLVGATPFGPVFSGLRPAGANTSLLLGVSVTRDFTVGARQSWVGTRGRSFSA